MVVAFVLTQASQPFLAQIVLIVVILIGSFELVKQTIYSLQHKRFALDYIALTAIVTGVLSGQLFVAAVICLMLAGGNELEKYARNRAKSSLKALVSRIPDTIYLWVNNALGAEILVKDVQIGQHVVVRRGEVLPIDGRLISDEAQIDESSLTGEALPAHKTSGDLVSSGTVNVGDQLIIEVTKTGAQSTYHKIIALVEKAQNNKSPLIRLADRYSGFFTIFTFFLAFITWLFSGSIDRALAVLVMATPCPLILATPIALLGGMNSLAKRGIIIKNLASIELLSQTTDLVFDKTGTLTLGELEVSAVTPLVRSYTKKQILTIAAAIERSSLHPIAKAIVSEANKQQLLLPKTENTIEVVGSGISAEIKNNKYSLKNSSHEGMVITLYENKMMIGEIELQDQPKPESSKILSELQSAGLKLHLLSGDIASRVSELVAVLKVPILSKSKCTPKSKTDYITDLQKQHAVVTMIGDGINDAPALATADVGIVFSHDEESASSNAADVVLITNKLSAVTQLITISNGTIAIALQSIWIGLGLSIIGMILSSMGKIPPIAGALTQEVIDVLVILNAIRASRLKT